MDDEKETESVPSVEDNELNTLCKTDDYMKHYFISDHIKPIKIGDDIHIVKNIEQETLKLTEQIESLKAKKVKKEKKEDIILPEYEKYELKEEDEERERINYGVFLHEVNIIDYSDINLIKDHCPLKCINANIHPISIKGSPYIKEILEFEDLSPYKSIYPAYKVEWFLSLEVNDSQLCEILPIHSGPRCIIPYEALGKYIFCKAYRRIHTCAPFQQVTKSVEKKPKTVFDPHTLRTKPLKLKNTPEYVEIFSTNTKGPVLISLDLTLQILLMFCINDYSIQVLVHDPFENLFHSPSTTPQQSNDTRSSNSNSYTLSEGTSNQQPFLATLTLNLNQLQLTLCTAPEGEIDTPVQNRNSDRWGQSYWKFDNFSSSEEQRDTYSMNKVMQKNNIRNNKSEFTYYRTGARKTNIFNLYEVDFRLSENNDFIILSIGDNIQNIYKPVKFRMTNIKPVNPNISMYQLWITLMTFKAAHMYNIVSTYQWKQIYKKGNLFYVQNMLHQYLIRSTTTHINDSLPLQKIHDIFNEN